MRGTRLTGTCLSSYISTEEAGNGWAPVINLNFLGPKAADLDKFPITNCPYLCYFKRTVISLIFA